MNREAFQIHEAMSQDVEFHGEENDQEQRGTI
jgi:hypothetical protein